MNKDLDALLCERYPLIFANRHASIKESCMAWGFSCGDGWFTLIDTLCERLQFWTDHNNAPQVVATQVKEKRGELCFYVDKADETQQGMIFMAAAMSSRICEQCGQTGQMFVTTRGWFLTRCEEHAPEGAISLVEYAKTNVVGNWL